VRKPSWQVRSGETGGTAGGRSREVNTIYVKAAAALIESMQAQLAEREREIERLNTEIKRWVNMYGQAALKWHQEHQECRKLQEEIERLRNTVEKGE
jgi:peptidoglycan hydrolase CwlO-like protein